MSGPDADDFAQTVHLRIAAANYDILRRFEGRSTLRTYLTVVTARMLKDWQNHEYGKWRPSAAAVRLGPAAVTLDRMINRDGADVGEAVRTVAAQGNLTETSVWAIASDVPRRGKRRLVALEAASTEAAEFPDPVAAQEAELEATAKKRALAQALAEMSPDEARLLVRRFVGRETVSALARQSGVDAKGLYRRFDRLRDELRARLETKGLTSAAVS